MTYSYSLAERARARAPARFSLASVALAAALCAQQAGAQTSTPAVKAPPQPMASTLTTTVVTATRTETPLDETLADVRVITAEQISQSAGRSLAEVLQRFAGAQLVSNGGRGQVQTLSIRGSKQLILLVDGVRFGSATAGDPSLQSIPLESIERIEVVHGPASALYGSDAIGGVIQIFTKQGKGSQTPWAPYASTTLGTAGYKDANVGFSGAQEGWNYSLNVARVLEPGFSVTNAQSSYFHPDDDTFRQTSANAAIGYAFNTAWRVDAQMLRADSFAEFDNGASKLSWTDNQAQTGQIKLSGVVNPHWKTQLSWGRSHDSQWTHDRTLSSGRVASSLFETTQNEFKWGHEVKTSAGIVTAGLERLEQEVTSTTAYDAIARATNAAYAGLNGSHGPHSWQANVRSDDNSQFGDFTTWGIGYGFQVLPSLRLHASRGKSIKAPTFNDLYWPRSGNPHLQPEQGLNTELGLNWSVSGHHLKLVRFDNKVHQLIAWAPDSTGNWLPANIDRARMKGWSLGYGTQWNQWSLSTQYEHLDAHDSKGARVAGRLAEHQATVSIDKALGAWKFGASALYVGERNESASKALPSYTTLDLHAHYQLARDWALQARVTNATDKQYTTSTGYNQRGRAAYVTLQWAMH